MNRFSPPALIGPSGRAPRLLAELDRQFSVREDGRSQGQRIYLDTPERRLTARGERLWMCRQGERLHLCHRSRRGRRLRQVPFSRTPRTLGELPPELRKGALRRAGAETPLEVIAVVDWRLRFTAVEGRIGDLPLVFEERKARHGRETNNLPAVVVMHPGANAEVVRAIESVASHHGFAAFEEDELEAALRGSTKPAGRRSALAEPAGRALLSALREERAALRRALPLALAGREVDALHQTRLALRRTRALLSNFRPLLPPLVRSRFARDFKWFQAASSPARDLDVLRMAVEARSTEAGESGAELLVAIDAARDEAQQELRETAHSRRALRFFRAWDALLARAPESLSPLADDPQGPIVRERLFRRARKLRGAVEALHVATPSEELHKVRIAAKKLRYGLEAFRSLCRRKPLARLLRKLRKVQEELGAIQDAAVQRELLAALPLPPSAEAAARAAIAPADQNGESDADRELGNQLEQLARQLRAKRMGELLPL